MDSEKPIIGILGAGKLGVVLSQLLLKAGYPVYIAGSGSPDKIKLSFEVLAPGAIATTHEIVAQKADIVILALPLGKHQNIARNLLNGKLVVDAMNYWWEIDGVREDLTDPLTSSSETVQKYFTGARVVKAFNHVGYHDLFDEPKPTGTKNRKAIAIAGNNDKDIAEIAKLVDAVGFDPVAAGSLEEGIRLEPGGEIFGANVTAAALRQLLDTFWKTTRGEEIAAARAKQKD